MAALLRTSQQDSYQRLTCRHLRTWLFTTNTDDLWISWTLRGSKASRRKPKLPVRFHGKQTSRLIQRLVFFCPDNRDTNQKQNELLFFQSLHYKVMSFARWDLQSRLAGVVVPGAESRTFDVPGFDHGARLMYSQHLRKQLWLASQCDCCPLSAA